MRMFMEKKGNNVILGNTAFYMGLFQPISVYMQPAWHSKSEKKKKKKSFDFYRNGILVQFLKNHIF